ncbi:MAG: DinB family protein [Anaerolineales bacterium]|nr:DinB family protein [Anaerolineales bacterium]
MSTPLVEIRQALMVSQAEFLALLARFQPETLHQQIDNEPWTPAVILLHMCEAREHYTADVGRLLASDFKARVGRATDDPQRMTEIAAAATGVATAEQIEGRLRDSFARMMRVLDGVQEADLDRPVTLARPGFEDLRLAGFIGRFLVGHHQMHVNQLTALTD